MFVIRPYHLCCIAMSMINYTNTYYIIITTQRRRRVKTSLKKYTPLFESWRWNQDCNILTSPTPPDIAVYRSRSPGLLNQRSRGPLHWMLFSLPHLDINSSDLQLTDFMSSPSYIIVQSPTQSLVWHVWSSSSGNNCHAVHRSLSSGASVYDCTMGFYLVQYCQPCPPTRFLLITAIGMCHFLPVHHFGMACLARWKVNI